MRKKMLAGNWKMNKTLAELPEFFASFAKSANLAQGARESQVDIVFAVPFTLLERAIDLAQPYGIKIAAQNVHFEKSGAFTGEISLGMIKELGVDTTLIGHSERRQYFAETDETVAKKIAACLAAGVTPIACVGETRGEREANQTNEVVKRQLAAILGAAPDVTKMVIAYEPVWAIGTGLSATSAQAQEIHKFIRGLVAKHSGEKPAEAVQILYGGSASPANIDELLSQPDIDGGLVGGASLKAQDFAKMVGAGRS